MLEPLGQGAHQDPLLLTSDTNRAKGGRGPPQGRLQLSGHASSGRDLGPRDTRHSQYVPTRGSGPTHLSSPPTRVEARSPLPASVTSGRQVWGSHEPAWDWVVCWDGWRNSGELLAHTCRALIGARLRNSRVHETPRTRCCLGAEGAWSPLTLSGHTTLPAPQCIPRPRSALNPAIRLGFLWGF